MKKVPGTNACPEVRIHNLGELILLNFKNNKTYSQEYFSYFTPNTFG